MRFVGLIVGLLIVAAPANATKIGFDAFAGNFAFVGPDYTEQGFDFTNPSGGNMDTALFTWGLSTKSADPTGNTLNNNYPNTLTSISRADGALFRFNSVDLTGVFNENVGGSILFTFTTALGSTTRLVTIDAFAGFQTFTFNRSDLISASYRPLTTGGQYVQADNFVFNEISAVPEPASWSLLIAGFAISGVALRRRRVIAA